MHPARDLTPVRSWRYFSLLGDDHRLSGVATPPVRREMTRPSLLSFPGRGRDTPPGSPGNDLTVLRGARGEKKSIENNGRSPGVNLGSPVKWLYRFPGRDAPRCLQTPVGPARDNPGSPCEMTPCSGEARFQRGGTPGSFGDWLYHFRGEIVAPVHSAIGFIILGKGEISARANNPGSPRECLFFSLLLFFRGKEKEEDVDEAGGDHTRANKSRGGTKEGRGWRTLRPPRVVFVIGCVSCNKFLA